MQNYRIFVFLHQYNQFYTSQNNSKHRTNNLMKIAYYMPFKTMGHQNPSGDLIIGTEIFDHLQLKGNTVEIVSKLRARWIYYSPAKLIKLFFEKRRVVKKLKVSPPGIWLSYHSYYKAPDLLGPHCCRKLGIPYVIFQGIYSTKRRKNVTTLIGYALNKKSLQSAEHIFTNKRRDLKNLSRIIPAEKLTYIAPGIQPQDFQFSEEEREKNRILWGCENDTLIMTAAMMRPGVKTEGIAKVIQSCSKLHKKGYQIRLIIAGDGECKGQLEQQANRLLPGRVIFLGKTRRKDLYKYYSSSDIFAFPGIHESLGMVYLEAQSCRLTVVAFEDWGAKEAICPGKTGLLSPASEPELFTKNIEKLILDPRLRRTLGQNGEKHISKSHDLIQNYELLQEKLKGLCISNMT